MPVVRALQDGPIVYVEDSGGKLHSFDVGDDNTLQGRRMFGFPIVGALYHGIFSNKLELGRDPCHPNPWSISYCSYQGSNSPTISLLELTNSYPAEIRNRSPFLPPWSSWLHRGPTGMVALDITAVDRWVVLSGYATDRRKVFAVRELDDDLGGRNFLAYYGWPFGEWKTSTLFSWMVRGASPPQRRAYLSEWQIYDLPEGAELTLLLRKAKERALLEIPLNKGESYVYFDVVARQYAEGQLEARVYNGKPWPCKEEQDFVLATRQA